MNVLWVSPNGPQHDLALQYAGALSSARPLPTECRPAASGSRNDFHWTHTVLSWQPRRPVVLTHTRSADNHQPIEAEGWSDPRLVAAIAERSPEVVVLLADFPSLWEADSALRDLDVPCVVYAGAPGPIRDGSLFRDLSRVCAVAVPSHFLRRELCEVAKDQDWRTLAMGVDPNLFRPLSTRAKLRRQAGLNGDFVVGCVARNREEEQLPTLLRAFKAFAADKPEAKLCLHVEEIRNPKSEIPNPKGWDLLELAHRYELRDRLRLCPLSLTVGAQEDLVSRLHRMNRLYNLFDVFVAPGQGDGFGAAILQAMAAGVPVVALDYGLCRELVRQRGLLVEVAGRWLASPHSEERAVADESNLASQLQRLYDDERLRQRCALKGREFAESRNWDIVAAGGARTFDLIAATRAAPPSKIRNPKSQIAHPQSSPRFLVRRERGLGDLLFSLSIAARLKELHPDAKIDVVTLPDYAEWVQWFDCVDRVFAEKPDNRYDRELDYEELLDYAYNGDRAQGMGRQAGVEVTRLVPPPTIPLKYQRAARKRLAAVHGSKEGPIIAFAPLGVKGTPNRSLTRDQIEGLLDCLLGDTKQPGPTVVLFDTNTIHGLDRPGLLNVSGQLRSAEALALLNECDVLLGVDSGLLHAAAVLRKPVVGLFTHINALHRLGCAERFIALQPSLPCFPCGDVWPRGPAGRHPVCRPTYRWSKQEPPLSCVALHRPSLAVEALRELLQKPDQRKVLNVDAAGSTTVWQLPALVEQKPKDLTSIIILNHNTWRECTRECLTTALRTTAEPFEIVLVDNGSSPQEYRQIQQDLAQLTNRKSETRNPKSKIRLVRVRNNVGYPRGINRGLREVSPDARYVCLLNSDCFLNEPRWNEKAAALFEKDWRLGALCLTRGEHRYFLDGETGQDYFFEDMERRGGDCEILNGSCLLVDRGRVGGLAMDERFSPGSREDDDLSFWIRSQGWSLGQCQEFDVVHRASQTLRKKGWKIRYQGREYDYHALLERNRRLLLRKWKAMLHPRLGSAESLEFVSRFYRPKVSVVMPTKDRLDSIAPTVASILAQDLEDFELLIVTASGKEAAVLAKRFKAEPRIRVLAQRQRGIANARNTGMRASRGLYIAHMDDDEIWHPAHLKELAEFLDFNETVDLVYGDVRKSQGRYVRGRYIERKDLGSPWCQPFDGERFKTGNWIPASAAMHRATLVGEVGCFDESFHYADDWEYWLRIAHGHGVAHRCTLTELGFATVEYRIHGGNATLRDQSLWRQDFERIAQRYIAVTRETPSGAGDAAQAS